METLAKSDIFFFITSVAVVLVTLGILIAIFYILRAVESFRKIAERAEGKVEGIEEDLKEMLLRIKESTVFHLLFRKKRRK